ncbi:MAG TPA: alpha-glucosidase [Candidatus Gallacutalibacter pullistercoris]|nr:alpha-glucosidase [Candidatus Gallacutalibacter pullistercoris]
MDRNKLRELLEQPMAQDLMDRFGMAGKPAEAFDEQTITKLEPVWKLVDATKLPIHVPVYGEYDRKWWKEAVIYQIYPMSFCDSNGDGIGDLPGIISKLDYLKELGVDVVWLSPIYDSPNDDNGYDIRDYQAIHPDYGTMEDFDRLLEETHKRGMKLIMDMVLNHTSDEHRWFQSALHDPDSPYKDFYIWRKGKADGTPPNNWQSFFSEPAWNYYPELDEWALHLFSRKQMDLNWENPKLRDEVVKILNWWLQKGVDGFRLDVINLISKFEGLPDGDPLFGLLGMEQYFYGPRLHEYLKDMNARAFSLYDSYTVGEGCGLGARTTNCISMQSAKELNTVFCFGHFEEPGRNKYEDYAYDLNFLKNYMLPIQQDEDIDCWNTVVFDNHDNPRFLNKVSRDPAECEKIARLIALMEMTLRGTVYLYQGQELGMRDTAFRGPEEFRDVEAINLYKSLIESGKTEEEAFAYVAPGTRDQARTPMQWTAGENAGFTTGTPWLRLADDYELRNAEAETADDASIFSFYRKAIALRHAYKTLVYGHFTAEQPELADFMGYTRRDDDGEFYVEMNLCNHTISRPRSVEGMECLLSNYEDTAADLRPYEAAVYRIR